LSYEKISKNNGNAQVERCKDRSSTVECGEYKLMTAGGIDGLPATVVTERRCVGGSEVTTATTTAATTTPTAITTTVAAATAVADHLSETGVDLLLGLREDSDQVTSLLSICKKS
jgi:hypothetical protein